MKSYEASALIEAPLDAVWVAQEPDRRATRFTMREEYTGPLLGLMWKSMPDLGPSFTQFASGLKREAEAKSRV